MTLVKPPVFEEFVKTYGMRAHEEGVFVKPSIVVEVTYQEVQETDEYMGGYALRVPKVVRFRHDKKVEEIDDVGKLQKLYELQYERYPLKSL